MPYVHAADWPGQRGPENHGDDRSRSMQGETKERALAQELNAARERLDERRQRAGESPAQQEAIEELSASPEELSVVAEELREKSDELIATRGLLESERQQYLDLFEMAPDGYIVTDSAGTIQRANRAAAKLLRVRQDLLVGKPLVIFVSEKEGKRFSERLVRLLENEETQKWEMEMQPRDGGSFPAAVTVSAIPGIPSTGGRAAGHRWLIHDITERVQAEKALRETEQRFRLMVEGVKDYAIFMLDPKGVVISWNAGAERIEGYLEKEILGRNFSLFYSPEEIAEGKPEEQLRSAAAKGRIEHQGWRLRKDGSRFWADVVMTAVRDENGELIGFSKVIRDLTERHQARVTLENAFEEIKTLKERLYHENVALREEIDRTWMFEEIVGSTRPVRVVLSRVAKVAPMDSTVLITGETGTGKELIARAIHKRSKRAGRAFVAFNCAGIPPSLIASELFGHEKGAFTGAQQRRLGRFELAEGGTIFLDEIGELTAETQIALLRVVQEREFERVGGRQPIPTDVRIIAATNRDLQDAVAAGTFRLDLFYRLNVFPIEAPPLRERKEDIPVLLDYFIKRYAAKAGKKIRSIDKRTVELFKDYHWPGNIRELQNVIERSVILCDGEIFSIDESWLSRALLDSHRSTSTLSERLLEQEKKMIESALSESRGKVAGILGAAAKLGIPSSTLESKIKMLKIKKNIFKAA